MTEKSFVRQHTESAMENGGLQQIFKISVSLPYSRLQLRFNCFLKGPSFQYIESSVYFIRLLYICSQTLQGLKAKELKGLVHTNLDVFEERVIGY